MNGMVYRCTLEPQRARTSRGFFFFFSGKTNPYAGPNAKVYQLTTVMSDNLSLSVRAWWLVDNYPIGAWPTGSFGGGWLLNNYVRRTSKLSRLWGSPKFSCQYFSAG